MACVIICEETMNFILMALINVCRTYVVNSVIENEVDTVCKIPAFVWFAFD